MHKEQIFTPEFVTTKILQELEYCQDKIRKKHVIDNSCGDGAMLSVIVREYIRYNKSIGISDEDTIDELEEYVHGIEVDGELVAKCIQNLNRIAKENNIKGNIKWDIKCADAMDVHEYDNRMDYVIGNPPYCKVHDLGDRYDKVKSFNFANGGMTDLYLVFFEIGINMLNENGKLGYITPTTWLKSKAGVNFKKYLSETNTLLEIWDYGHKKVFEGVNTYSCITILSKSPKKTDAFIYGKEEDGNYSLISLNDCFIDNNIYLSDSKRLKELRQIYNCNKKYVRVKNGFATLNDKFFIIDDIIEEHPNYASDLNVIQTIKASNNEEHYFFYPYDINGKPMKLCHINNALSHEMIKKAEKMNICIIGPNWYLYGRTQALNDVQQTKLALNNLIKDVNTINTRILVNGEGIYSGFYIVFNNNERHIGYIDLISLIKTDDFVNYIKLVGQYKSSGYYSFKTKDVEKYLNFKIFQLF